MKAFSRVGAVLLMAALLVSACSRGSSHTHDEKVVMYVGEQRGFNVTNAEISKSNPNAATVWVHGGDQDMIVPIQARRDAAGNWHLGCKTINGQFIAFDNTSDPPDHTGAGTTLRGLFNQHMQCPMFKPDDLATAPPSPAH